MVRSGGAVRGAAVVFAAVVMTLVSACSGPAPDAAPATAGGSSIGASGAGGDPSGNASASPSADTSGILNVWTADGSVDPKALPLGDGKTSTTGPSSAHVFTCSTAGAGGVGGASVEGPWIHGSTFDSTAKVRVTGDVTWPSADLSITVDGDTRTIKTNDLPVTTHTGTFPISASDPAHTYDQNPNRITAQSDTVELPVHPTAAVTPGCLPMGPIGILANGVFLFNALDGPGRDAVAHETQDLCDGHPAPGDEYHYHDIPSCLLSAATGPSTLIGWADDGYPIFVERDASGSLPTDVDLDDCHGRTSPVLLDGKVVSTYHYDATLEYPYTLGCFHGTDAVPGAGAADGAGAAGAAGGGPAGTRPRPPGAPNGPGGPGNGPGNGPGGGPGGGPPP